MSRAELTHSLHLVVDAAPSRGNDVVAFGPFRLIVTRRELTENNQLVRLGSRALEILMILIRHAGEVVSKDRLLAEVWPGAVIDEGTLRVQIATLRKTLGDGTAGRRYITNVPQRGYCFVAPLVSILSPGPELVALPPIQLPMNLAKQAALPTISLIGRDDVVDSVLALLSVRRFVTIVGPGGIGKTSVALAVAHSRQREATHGTYLVDLDKITNPASVPCAIASALGLPLMTTDPAHCIAAFLEDKHVLLLLDNCEHVVSMTAQIAEQLLAAAPAIRILATSREPLHARGEWVQRLAPLRLPDAAMPASASEAKRFSAIELFVERTVASLDGFTLSDADVPYVTKICRRLDGIPLAIELAARRVGLFGLRELAIMLDDKLSLSTQGHRTAFPRHKTMLAALDWSYELLTETEKASLCCLSVFSESFSLDSALKITGGVGIDIAEAIEAMASLVDKSLLLMQQDKLTVSYRLLNTTRTYASGRRHEFFSSAAIQRQYAALVVEMLTNANRELAGKSLTDWRQDHCRKIDDVRAALEWAFSAEGDPDVAVELLVASSSIWFHLLLLNDYLAWLGKAKTVASGGQRNSSQKAQLALAIGIALLYARGPIHETLRALSEGFDLASEMNNNAVQQRALWGLCSYHHLKGDYRQALHYANQLGESARHAGNQFADLTYHRIAAASSHLMGDHAAAREHIVKALAPHYVRRNMPQGSVYQVDHLSASLMQLARILWIQGYPDRAMRTIEEALAQAEKTNQVLSVIYVLLFGACPIALWAGEIDLAHEYVLKLEVCTTDKALPFCREWARKYAQALVLMVENSESVDPIPITPDFEEPPACDSLADMLATMDIRLVGERAIERANASENGWCAPEIFRAQGEQLLKRENCREAETETETEAQAQAEQLFVRSLALAKGQGANFWILRTSLSYAGLLSAQGKVQTARQVLGDALSKFSERRGVQALLEATDFLNRLSD